MECTVSAYGLKGTGSFLLVPMGATYAFGTRLTLLGTTLAGMTVEASTYFGAWSLGKAFNEINKGLFRRMADEGKVATRESLGY